MQYKRNNYVSFRRKQMYNGHNKKCNLHTIILNIEKKIKNTY